jgi:hypothetical protein
MTLIPPGYPERVSTSRIYSSELLFLSMSSSAAYDCQTRGPRASDARVHSRPVRRTSYDTCH